MDSQIPIHALKKHLMSIHINYKKYVLGHQSSWMILEGFCFNVELFSFQQNPRLLSPGSGNISSRYAGWNSSSPQQQQQQQQQQRQHQEDEDSGTGSTSCESHVIRHIDRNILACQICHHRYRDPKVIVVNCKLYQSNTKLIIFNL